MSAQGSSNCFFHLGNTGNNDSNEDIGIDDSDLMGQMFVGTKKGRDKAQNQNKKKKQKVNGELKLAQVESTLSLKSNMVDGLVQSQYLEAKLEEVGREAYQEYAQVKTQVDSSNNTSKSPQKPKQDTEQASKLSSLH